MTTRSQSRQIFTLTVTRVSQQPTQIFALTVIPRRTPLNDGGWLIMTAQSQLKQVHLDGHLSESTAYAGFRLDGYPSGSPENGLTHYECSESV